jgi:putative ABC transport system permease protein
VIQELRLAIRRLRIRWTFTAVAVLTMALGIGVSVALFSFVHALLLRPLPFSEPDRLVSLSSLVRGERRGLSFREIDDLRAQSRHIAAIAGYDEGGHYNLTGGDRPEDVLSTRCTHNLFQVLGVAPLVGAAWTDTEDRSRYTEVLLGYDLWVRYFNSDRNIIGKQITLVDVPYTVRGVMPPGFGFPSQSEIFRSWGTTNLPQSYQNRANRGASVVARIRPGVSLDQVQAELDTIARDLAASYPATNRDVRFIARTLRETYVGDTRPYLLLLAAAVVLVFAVALANVTNLLLIRGIERRRAVAVQLSLGASSWQVARSLLTESVLLAAIGGASSLILAHLMIAALTAAVRWEMPAWMDVRIDRPVLLFLIALSTVTGLLAGLLPALKAARVDVNELLKEGSRGSAPDSRLQTALVAAEVALATVLLIGSVLLTKSFVQLARADLGYDPERLLTFRVTVPWKRYGLEGTIRFHHQVLERLAQLPGVEGVSLSTDSPVAEQLEPMNPVRVEGQSVADQDANPRIWVRSVTPGYHDRMGIPLVRGRAFDAQDHLTRPPVALVDETLAARLWPGQDPIGRKLQLWPSLEGTRWLTVVGVVRDVRIGGPTVERGLMVYTCAEQLIAAGAYYLLRTRGDPRALASAAERAVASVDPTQAITRPVAVTDLIAGRTWQRRVAAMLFNLFSVLALLLAAIGIYGVTSYHVARQTAALGLRVALGARPEAILWMIGGQCARLISFGLIGGILLALWLSRFVASILYETSSRDTLAFIAAPALLAAVTLASAYIPARRATRVDPIIALREGSS